MKTVQRKDIIKDIHERTDGLLTVKEVELIVSLYEEAISDFISEAYKVQLSGFLTLEPVVQAARTGRHIVTGERLNVPEKPSIKLRQGRAIKRALEAMSVDDIKVAQTISSTSPHRVSKKSRTGKGFAKKNTPNVIEAINGAIEKDED